MRTKTREMTLEERFVNCHPGFQDDIRQLAAKHSKTREAVYGWWREYSETCRNYDQSAVWSEFLEWYRPQLGGGA